MDRLEFRKIVQQRGRYRCATSGSTGVPVVVEKYVAQQESRRRVQELINRWHGWDNKAPTLRMTPEHPTPVHYGNITGSAVPVEGCTHKQLMGFTSLFPKDLSQFTKILAIGETWSGVGIDIYSSEEFGVIAVQCPHNDQVLHVMSHLIVVCDPELGLVITDKTHPYLKEYEIGDFASPATCSCDISLPAISHVQGRIRNRIKMPDGTTAWPLLGFRGRTDVDRFQVFQDGLTSLRVHVTGLTISHDTLKQRVRDALGYDFDIQVVNGNFKPGKFEEFVCEI